LLGYLRASDRVALSALRDEVADDPSVAELLPAVTIDDLQIWEGQAILCLVDSRLRDAGLIGHLQPAVATQLASVDREYQRITNLYLEASHEVTSVLSQAGIPVVVIKDARGFPMPHLRPSYDLDLLVPADMLEKCGTVLQSAGFAQRHGPRQERLLAREASWSRPCGSIRISIDLHWHILDSYRPRRRRVRIGEFFDNAITVSLGGYRLPALLLEHHLLALCLHTFEHELRFPSRLITWLDVSETIRSLGQRINWDKFLELCDEFDAKNEVYLGLRVASTVLGVHAADQFAAAMRPAYYTHGIEQSCFGYWNYPIKFLDDVDRHCRRPHSGFAVAKQALASAKQVWQLCDQLALNVVARGGTVATFGQPAELFVPDEKFKPVGDIEFCITGLKSADVEHLLQDPALELTPDPQTEVPGSLHRRYTRDMGDLVFGCEIIRVPSSQFRTRHDVRWLASGLLTRPARSRQCIVRILVAPDPAAQARFLLSRLRGLDAVELMSLVLLADLLASCDETELDDLRKIAVEPRDHVIMSLAAGEHAPEPQEQAPEQPGTWSFLAGLDNRSLGLESLTKFMVAPQGVRAIALLSGGGSARVLAIMGELLRRPRGLIDDIRYLATEVSSPTGRRVPPRLYLTPDGSRLTSLRR